jgi:hypothetical protein
MRNSRRAFGQICCTGAMAALLLGSASAPAVAACTRAITITENNQLNFGTIGASSAGGTVTVSTSGGVTGPAGFFFTGAASAGNFTVRGSRNCMVFISFTPGALTGPGASMTLDNFTNNAGATPTLTGGRLTFSVGGDLHVNAAQQGGGYNGTYVVTVIY